MIIIHQSISVHHKDFCCDPSSISVHRRDFCHDHHPSPIITMSRGGFKMVYRLDMGCVKRRYTWVHCFMSQTSQRSPPDDTGKRRSTALPIIIHHGRSGDAAIHVQARKLESYVHVLSWRQCAEGCLWLHRHMQRSTQRAAAPQH